ncbi:pentapeptide repeat-containing protein [Actinoplanes sp. NEAU-A12]|uniref:Pentapeptide repeat-containing protein n=1 Tax=Actinoplanes sandaracinus TaxID=3045177 RepID=A0ABT6WDV7_9ACTN|nr:pentapeptide repeat-containing protein [Actinoplanes sandaracinus]MDI6097916.1 pentapeptide repeat-containing protein [Actinoplanes sandaracinus]
MVFDCFGAGQRITQDTFGGRDWRSAPELAGDMFALLPVVRQLHELMWYLTEALKLDDARRLHPKLRAAFDETDALAASAPAELRRLDVEAYRTKIVPLLRRASEMVRARSGGRRPDHSGARLIGRRMRGADLRGASFRGALLIGADLRDADLRRADFTGADMRGTDLRGANLDGVLFLTASQLRAAVTETDHP